MITLKMSTGKTKRINRAPNKEYVMEGFLEPGLVSYEESGDGVSRLDKPAIDKMLASFVGCPLVIEHTDEPKAEVLNGKKNAEGKPIKVGEVKRAWWNAETGKYDCSFTTEDEEALKKINEDGWSGSCAYNVREPLGPAGELHAMRYDNTILDGEFEHLALVPNPRYEDCTIRMNGKPASIKDNAGDQGLKELKEKYEKENSKENAKVKCPTCGLEHAEEYLHACADKENEKETTLGTCPRCGVAGDNVDGDQAECTACGHKYTPGTKKNDRGREAKEMFDKERKEHPEFTEFQIWEIVEDHMKKKENASIDSYEEALKERIFADAYYDAMREGKTYQEAHKIGNLAIEKAKREGKFNSTVTLKNSEKKITLKQK